MVGSDIPSTSSSNFIYNAEIYTNLTINNSIPLSIMSSLRDLLHPF